MLRKGSIAKMEDGVSPDEEIKEARARLAAIHEELASLGSEPEIRVRQRHSIEAPVPHTPPRK